MRPGSHGPVGRAGSAVVGLLALAVASCHRPAPNPHAHGSAAQRLRPATTPLAEPSVRRTVYVPVYSSIYLGLELDQRTVELASTMSVRNVSPRHPIRLEFVRYYDSEGRRVRDYVNAPSELGPLATVEFVIPRADTAGGPGANFLVGWAGPAEVDEPLIEAVMIGQSGNAGISFTTSGRVVKDAPLP